MSDRIFSFLFTFFPIKLLSSLSFRNSFLLINIFFNINIAKYSCAEMFHITYCTFNYSYNVLICKSFRSIKSVNIETFERTFYASFMRKPNVECSQFVSVKKIPSLNLKFSYRTIRLFVTSFSFNRLDLSKINLNYKNTHTNSIRTV